MSNYPAPLAVIVPEYVTTDESNGKQYVYLHGFACLNVERRGRGFHFEEHRRVDPTTSASVELFDALTDHLDPQASLAGHRLDRTIAAFVRLPVDDPQEAAAKPALEQLRAVLANEVQDAAWYDRDPHRPLEQLAADFDLPAEWRRPTRQMRSEASERELSAKAQSIWLSIAHACLSSDELRRALADYDQWRTANAIV